MEQPYLANVAVAKEWRRLGVAQRMLAVAEFICTSLGHRMLWCHIRGGRDDLVRIHVQIEELILELAMTFLASHSDQILLVRGLHSCCKCWTHLSDRRCRDASSTWYVARIS